jgi:hypothetical protein
VSFFCVGQVAQIVRLGLTLLSLETSEAAGQEKEVTLRLNETRSMVSCDEEISLRASRVETNATHETQGEEE